MIATSVQTENLSHAIGSMPAYRLRPDGQAVVTVDGVEQSLGRYGSEASRRRYLVILAGLQSNGFLQQTVPASIANYRRLKARKERERAERAEQERLRRERRKERNELKARRRQERLKRKTEIQQERERSKLARVQAEQERAKRLSKRVDDHVVEATIKQLSPVLADMVRVQRLLGCEPQELCGITPGDVNRRGSKIIIDLRSRKTYGKIRTRSVQLGDEAYAILKPYLDRPDNKACFSPVESLAKSSELKRAMATKPRRVAYQRAPINPDRLPRDEYVPSRYVTRIQEAATRAFPVPHGLTSDQVDQWIEKHHWHPKQLVRNDESKNIVRNEEHE